MRTGLIGGLISAAVVAALVFVAGCSGSSDASGSASPSEPVAKVTAEPGDGASGVSPTAPVKLTVANGELEDVKLTNPEGKQVEGKRSEDHRTWTATEKLGYGKTYTWSGKARGTDGKDVPIQGSFSTVQPAQVLRGTIYPLDNQTVGVAMPISIRFDAPVKDKAAVEKALQVKTSVPVTGSWGWVEGDREVHWRPKEYWPAGTEVTVTADLYGVNYGDGVYGKDDLSTHFTIGRNQVVRINTPDHQMVVYRDGREVARYASSNGRDNDPELTTPNGTFYVTEKHERWKFDNPRYGYTNVWKNWAVRFSNHGEFIHENEDNRANIGRANTSHGCVNLTNTDAKAYFDSALVGDPVEVTGSITDMPPRYAPYDWLIPWDQWQAKSALK
ncbi:L,D-transpeptidase [Longimycelium tulufanense]|nr:Ig-like domain-containing protein [Longimycelium tulufanense]